VILEARCKHAVIHMIAQTLHDEKGNSIFRIFFKAQKMIDNDTMAPMLACISIDSIVGPCIAIPYNLDALTNKYFFIFKDTSSMAKHIS
jgi:hypothetical protein